MEVRPELEGIPMEVARMVLDNVQAEGNKTLEVGSSLALEGMVPAECMLQAVDMAPEVGTPLPQDTVRPLGRGTAESMDQSLAVVDSGLLGSRRLVPEGIQGRTLHH